MAWIFKEGEKPNILRALILTAVGACSANLKQRGPNLEACLVHALVFFLLLTTFCKTALVIAPGLEELVALRCGQACELAPQMALALLLLLLAGCCAGNADGAVWKICAFQVAAGNQMVFDKILINVLGSIENKI